jgi:hypothetical protein
MRKVVVATSSEIIAVTGNTGKKIKGEAAILKWVNDCGRGGVRILYHPIEVKGEKDVMLYGGQPNTPGLYIADQLAREKWEKSGKTVLKKVKEYLDRGSKFSLVVQDSFGKSNRMGVTWEDSDYLIIK